MNYEKAHEEHKAKAPFKTFEEAVKSPTYKAMHDARKEAKSKALSNKKDVGYSDKNHEQFHPEKSKKEYHNMQVRNIKKATKEWGLK